jgi:hypothetical protein
MNQSWSSTMCGENNLQTISRETSVLMSSNKAGLWTPQGVNEAGCVRSSKTGDMGSKTGVPAG